MNRRSILTGMLASAASASASAQAQSGVHMRTMPSTGVAVPAIGLGTFMTFDVVPGAPRDHLTQVLRASFEGGVRVVDTSPLYGMSEVNVGAATAALGIGDQLFYSNKIWVTGDYLGDASHAEESFAQSTQRLARPTLDLVSVHNLVNLEGNLAILRAWKNEGRIRHIGATTHDPAYFGVVTRLVENRAVDCIQIRYSLFMRAAEERLLPLARDRGVAVNVNMPFEKARLFQLVGDRPLPEFAREAGIAHWADYFLKWIISHPAVTCVLPATSSPAHAAENVAALRGELPDQRLRARMASYIASLPGFDRLDSMPHYPGRTYPGLVSQAQQAVRERAARR